MSLKDDAAAVVSAVLPEHKEQFGRTFLGSLLGQAVVMLGMSLAYLAALGLIYKYYSEDLAGLREWAGAPLFWGIVLLPALVILVFSLVPTALRGWRERRLGRLTIASAGRRAGQFRLHPYGPQDQDSFVRPDGADDRAVAWLEATDQSLLYLFGASGAGKSSLLAAGVLPRLEAAGWECLTVRVDQDPASRLREALLEAPRLFAKTPSPNASLPTLLERASRERERVGGQPLLLVVDQFEEFLILNDEVARAPVIKLLRDLDDEPLPGLRLLCVFRSDYRELLFKLGLPRYVPGVNAFELAPFLRDEAESFLRRGGHVLSAAGYQSLFAGLDRIEEARGLYRPITLNMVGLVLERMGGRIDGDPARLIEWYLRNSLAHGRSRDFAPAVLGRMITEFGTKEPRDLTTLATLTKFEPWQVESTLTDLEGLGIVRALDGDRTRWEISHDFLARQIGILLGRLRRAWVRRAAPIVLPAAAVAWAAMLFFVIEYWPSLQERNALAEVRKLGFSQQTFQDGDGLVAELESINEISLLKMRDIALNFRSPPKVLVLANADNITSLEALRGMPLTSLNLSGADGITSLEPLTGMPLTSLDLSNTVGIKSLDGLAGMPLTSLDLSYNMSIASLEPLRGMPLNSLNLSFALGVIDLEPLRGVPLTSLNLSNNNGVTDLGPLAGMPLISLNLSYTEGITDLGPLAGMPLTSLNLSNAEVITSLEPLRGMPLTKLDLTAAWGLTSLEPLRGMPLASLNLASAQGITDLEPLAGMLLTSLDLSNAQGVTSLEPLRGMPLTSLSLESARGITDLEPLAGIPLESLDLSNAPGITSLEPLRGMHLTSLNLESARGITNLEPLAGMPLFSLTLADIRTVSSLEPLSGMPLTELDLTNADGITSLEPLAGMPLISLNLSRADEITNLDPLRGMQLRYLDLSRSKRITSLDPLAGMPLASLDLTDAVGITNLAPLKGNNPTIIRGASRELLLTMQ